MTDRQIYERAVAELRRCEERAEQLRMFVRTYEELAGSGDVGRSHVATESVPAKAVNVGGWEEWVIKALEEAPRPLRVKEIYERVGGMLDISGERPVDVLWTRINRSDHFKKVGRGLYTLRSGDEGASRDDEANTRSTDVILTTNCENNEETPQPGVEPRSKADLMGSTAPIGGLLGLRDVLERQKLS